MLRIHKQLLKMLVTYKLCICDTIGRINLKIALLFGELGKAVFQACMHSSTDDVLVMANAANRIRRVLFCESQIFDGDTSLECQESSVPTIIVRLVSMILEGGKPNTELNESQRRIACNIAQIIQFKDVKQMRKETTVKFRHPRKMNCHYQLLLISKFTPRRGKKH